MLQKIAKADTKLACRMGKVTNVFWGRVRVRARAMKCNIFPLVLQNVMNMT